MCDSWRKPAALELSLAEIEKAFDKLPQMDGVRLSGGEPFLRNDFDQIVFLIQNKLRPLFVHVTTNGLLTDRIVAFCEKRDKDIPLQMLVSLDGFGDKHNEIRGIKTAWKRTTETLRTLAPRQKALNLQIGINQTLVDSDCLEQYKKVRDFLAPLGLRNYLVIAYNKSATYSIDSESDLSPHQPAAFSCFGHIEQTHLQNLFDTLAHDIDRYPMMERLMKSYYTEGIRARLLHSQASPNPPCIALDSHIRINPDGTIPTCQFNGTAVGNLHEAPFQDIWYSELARQQREWVLRCPGCWAECEVLPSAVYSGDILRHLLKQKFV